MTYVARVVLVKSVLSSLKGYWSQLFLLPKNVVKCIEAVCRNFLWNGVEMTRKKPDVAWSQVSKPMDCGGLYIWDFVKWNQAAILKQLWAL